MNVKELLTNEELMNNIVEDIEEIPEDTEVTYEVWVFMNEHEDYTRATEFFIDEFKDPDKAIECAKAFSYETVHKKCNKRFAKDSFFTIDVETVVEDPENDGTMNIGTIYSRDLWLDGEYGSEENVPEIEEPFVSVLSSDCKLIDDGILKIRCDLLKNYNKNDLVKLYFIDEPDTSILTYKIISKVTYVDGDYYHCDLMI